MAKSGFSENAAGHGTSCADLFLSGRCGSDARSELSLAQAADSFHYSVGACLIVKRAGNTDAVSDQFKALVVDCGITYPDECFGFLLVLHAQIEPYFVGLGHFLAILCAHQMNSALTCDRLDDAILCENRNTSTRDHRFIMSSEGVEVDEALIVYISDNEAKLINMTCKKKTRIALWVHCRESVTHSIAAIGIGIVFDVAIDDSLRFVFCTRG
jgi:hypothetical protein